MRTNLKIFRVKKELTQAEIAEKIGCNRTTYADVENGRRCGRDKFWQGLQKAFNVPDKEMWELTKND